VPRPNKHGFTLIEVLVVISIITILIALLLPSLGAARERANAVVCGSALNQAGTATLSYTNDNKGYLPFVGLINSTPIGANWRVNGSYTPFYFLAWRGYIDSPIGDLSTRCKIRCPSNEYLTIGTINSPIAGDNYSVNYALFGAQVWLWDEGTTTDRIGVYGGPNVNLVTPPIKRLDKDRMPSTALMMADGTTYGEFPGTPTGAVSNTMRVSQSWWIPANLGIKHMPLSSDYSAADIATINAFGYWHLDSPNGLFGDGHVENGHPKRDYAVATDSSKWAFPFESYRVVNGTYYGAANYKGP